MSCDENIEYWRLVQKYSTISGLTPTIPPSQNHNDGTWSDTDLYIGELFINTADNKIWMRTEDGIHQISGTGGTGSFLGDYVPVSGGTYSGPIYSPTMSANGVTAYLISASAFNGLQFGSSQSTYYGDGSNLTGINVNWNGGTVSNVVHFNGSVTLNNDLVINGPISTDDTCIDIQSDVCVNADISALYYYGDGSNLTGIVASSSNFYTEDVYLDGTTLVFDRTDTPSAYFINLQPILGTNSIQYTYWDSLLNQYSIITNGGDTFTTTISDFSSLSVTGDVTANNFYGTLVGTYSNDIYTLSADLIGTEQIFTRTDGSTYSTDLSSLAGGGGGGGSQSLSQTLLIGNSTGANDIIIENGQYLRNGLTSSSIFYDDEILDIRVSDELYDNLTERTPNLLHSNVNDLTNGDLTDIIQGFLEGGPAIILDVTTSGGDAISRVSLAPSTIELRTESEAEDRLITDTISDTNIVKSISMPTDPNTYYSETSNIFQNETIITNSEYTLIETKNAIDPKHEVRITQPNIDDTQSLRQQFVNQIYDEVTDGVNQSSSTLTVESIYHSVLSGEGQEDYININNDGVTLGEVEGSSFTNFIVNNDNGFYKSQFQSTGAALKSASKEKFVSIETTDGATMSVVYPLSDLEVETGAIAVKATVTAFNASQAYVAELYAAVRINSYTPTIISVVDKTEKTEFTTATSTIDIESSNLAILVKGETGETIFWSIKYELIYSVPNS